MIEMLTPFYIPMFVVEIKDWDTKKKRLLSMVDWNNPDANQEDHFTDYHLNDKDGCPYQVEFGELLSEDFQLVSNRLGADLTLKSVWAQRYSKEKSMHVHRHGSTGFSCVLFVDFNPSQHEATTFVAPFNNFVNDEDLTFTPIVKEGTLLVFPSMLLHYAAPNASSELRTIFSLNIDTKTLPRQDDT